MDLKDKYKILVQRGIQETTFEKQLDYLETNFSKICFSTSFSYEDQLITFLIKDKTIHFFTLDTGRLFEETYDTWNRTIAAYKIKIETFYPNENQLKDLVTLNGPNSFYKSVENRKECCNIRKVIPLKKALKDQEIWITGLRAEHSPNRKNLNVFEWDEDNQIIKFHPLLHWKTEDVITFIKKNQIPYNYLHNKGFVSIGCEPCTRKISEGENFRAGRWWWEEESKKECGLHFTNQEK